MAKRLLPVLRQRYFDSNGDPLSGGKLYSYIAGTSTPQATYTDQGGLTANTNPVILDANGEANVWLTIGATYKFVLTDSADVSQWTVDNVTSASAPGSSDAADAAAAADEADISAAAAAASAADAAASEASVAADAAAAAASASAAAASAVASDASADAALVSETNAAASAVAAAASAASITLPLPVASGGTGTTTAFTAGSVVFAGSSGVYTQDNSNFFWDDTNNRLGIGTSSPSSGVHVSKSGSSGATTSTSASSVTVTTGTFTDSSTAGSGTSTGYNGSIFLQPTLAATNASVTSTNVSNLHVRGPVIAGTNQTLTSTYGLWVSTGASVTSGATTSYAARLDPSTGATNNYSLYVSSGNSGFGTSAPSAIVHLSGNLNHGTLPNATTGAAKLLVTNGASTDNTTAASGTNTAYNFNNFYLGTLAAANTSVTTTNVSNILASYPNASTNMTITNAHALRIPTASLTSTTNAYGISVTAPTGATNNYAAQFIGGNVGVGTAAPTTRLQVQAPSNSTTDYPLTISNLSSTTGMQIGAYGCSNRVFGASNISYTIDTGGAFIVNTNNAQCGSANTAGNWSFGTASTSGTNAATVHAFSAASAATSVGMAVESTNGNGYSGALAFRVNPSGGGGPYSAGTINGVNSNNAGATDGGKLEFYTADQAGSHTLNKRMTIDHAGNVGIGTASPGSMLHVAGTQQGLVTAVSADTTLGSHYIVSVDDSAATRTMTLPAASSTIIGRVYRIKKMSASNTTVISRAGSDTIDGATSFTLTAQYQAVDVICLTSTTWGIF